MDRSINGRGVVRPTPTYGPEWEEPQVSNWDTEEIDLAFDIIPMTVELLVNLETELWEFGRIWVYGVDCTHSPELDLTALRVAIEATEVIQGEVPWFI